MADDFLKDAALVLGAGGAAGSIFETMAGADRQEDLLELQAGQEELRGKQQGLARARKMRQVMAAQTVKAAAGGVETASPSFQAIQRSSYDAFQQDNDIEALNLSLNREKLDAQKEALRDKEASGIFSTFLSVASLAATVAKL